MFKVWIEQVKKVLRDEYELAFLQHLNAQEATLTRQMFEDGQTPETAAEYLALPFLTAIEDGERLN